MRGHDVLDTICWRGIHWAFVSVAVGGSMASVAEDTWRGLVVAPEYRCSAYDSNDYSYAQSLEARIVARLGDIYSPYTGRCFDNARETDIEHIVARSEAHDSGLCAADVATRRRFAADLANLTLASPEVNRYQKGAKDASAWLPEQNRCWFANRIVDVRRKYGLTIDEREVEALEPLLATCQSTALMAPDCTVDAGVGRFFRGWRLQLADRAEGTDSDR